MRWRALVVAAVAGLLVLLSGGPAMAKGADRATISGPGMAGPIVLGGDGAAGEPGSGGDLATLAEGSGLFLAMFGADGGQRLTQSQPTGALGPRYELAYRVPDGSPDPSTVTQDLYPEAAGGPVTYTRAGQQVFGSTTTGGWYRAPANFPALLAKLGVPGVTARVASAAAPSAPAAAAPTVRQSRPAGYWIALGAAVLVVFAVGSAVLVRRRVAHAGRSAGRSAAAG